MRRGVRGLTLSGGASCSSRVGVGANRKVGGQLWGWWYLRRALCWQSGGRGGGGGHWLWGGRWRRYGRGRDSNAWRGFRRVGRGGCCTCSSTRHTETGSPGEKRTRVTEQREERSKRRNKATGRRDRNSE